MKAFTTATLLIVGLCCSACSSPSKKKRLTIEVNREKFEYRLVAHAPGIVVTKDDIDPWKMPCPHGVSIQLAFAEMPRPQGLDGYTPEVMISDIYKPSHSTLTTQAPGPVTDWYRVSILLPDLNDRDLAALRAFRLIWFVGAKDHHTITTDWLPITSKDLAKLSGAPH